MPASMRAEQKLSYKQRAQLHRYAAELLEAHAESSKMRAKEARGKITGYLQALQDDGTINEMDTIALYGEYCA